MKTVKIRGSNFLKVDTAKYVDSMASIDVYLYLVSAMFPKFEDITFSVNTAIKEKEREVSAI